MLLPPSKSMGDNETNKSQTSSQPPSGPSALESQKGTGVASSALSVR